MFAFEYSPRMVAAVQTEKNFRQILEERLKSSPTGQPKPDQPTDLPFEEINPIRDGRAEPKAPTEIGTDRDPLSEAFHQTLDELNAALESNAPVNSIQYFESRSLANHPRCLLYTSPSPRDLSTSRMPSSA